MQQQLIDQYISSQVSLNIFENLPSTNQKLWELLEQGAAPQTVVIALEQTAGRGQWGRQWNSARGGLYLSLGLAPNLPAANSAQLTMCSAWGIATALRSYGIPALMKWPNDLILNKKKLGGILTETRIQQGLITKAIVGVGINWSNPVPETGINLESFFKESNQRKITSLEMLAAITINGILSGYEYLLEQGIESLVAGYLKLLVSLGREVLTEEGSGIVIGVNTNNELKVCLNSVTANPEIYLKPGTINLGYDA